MLLSPITQTPTRTSDVEERWIYQRVPSLVRTHRPVILKSAFGRRSDSVSRSFLSRSLLLFSSSRHPSRHDLEVRRNRRVVVRVEGALDGERVQLRPDSRPLDPPVRAAHHTRRARVPIRTAAVHGEAGELWRGLAAVAEREAKVARLVLDAALPARRAHPAAARTLDVLARLVLLAAEPGRRNVCGLCGGCCWVGGRRWSRGRRWTCQG